MEQTLLSIEHLKKSYDDNLILDDINLEVHQGEVIVLVGPSGCGKSTMLRCINALEPIQGGEIKLNGEKIDPKNKNIAELRQKIGMVFQSYELFPHLTVLDNILLAPMKVQKRNKEEVKKEAEQLLESLRSWCQKNESIEIVVNDWGMAQLVGRYPEQFELCMGTLLNKRKKDPRMAYKLGDRTLFEQNSVHAAFYREYLKEEFRMERYEWESCGNTGTGKFPEGKNSMHLPFYQTNTSQYCPLYVACTKGSRSAQMPVRECPRFCEKQAFLYPEHLRMMGRYNSLFGVDLDVWKRMREMLKLCGVDRVVVNLL